MLTISLFQLIFVTLVVLGFLVLSFAIGLSEGRAREACEPTQEIDEDDGESLGRRHRP